MFIPNPLENPFRSSLYITPFFDFVSFFGDNISREGLLAALAATPGEVVEVMCHPGRVDAELEGCSSYRAERERELAILTDPGLADELEAQGWIISDYRVLCEDSPA